MSKLAFVLISVSALLNCAATSDQGAGSSKEIRATTSSGRVVVLRPDGKWNYADAEIAPASSVSTSAPAGATDEYLSARGFFSLKYDPTVWRRSSSSLSDDAEASFQHVDGDVYAMAIVERIEIPLDTLADVVLENMSARASDLTVVKRERPRVDGNETIRIQFNATVQGIKVSYIDQLWSSPSGSVQVLAFTSANLFSEYEDALIDLMNGAVYHGSPSE